MNGLGNMNKDRYKAYLQSLGNQQHYIGCIPELLKLEQELNINLDDYIPYNDDYSKVNELNTILSKEKLYSEKLQFSINSYMCYCLSDFDSNKANTKETNETNEKNICSEYFSFKGSESELKSTLSMFMSEEDSQFFINNCKDIIKCLNDDEYIETTMSFPQNNSSSDLTHMHLLISSSNYNINIKALSLVTIALLLDIKLTLGFASAILSVIGFNNQAIARIDVSEGEKCLILEAMRANNRIIDENVFAVCNSQCVHNDLKCKYQDGDKCTMKKDDIKRVLNELCNKNIFKRIKNLYKYNF